MEQSEKIIKSAGYVSFIKGVQKRANIKILDEYLETAASRDSQKMAMANLSVDKAIYILKNDNKLLNYVLLKLQKYENVKVEEEYPKGEEVEEEDNNETFLGYSQSFLLLYLIEYYLLTEFPEKLLSYLTAIRIPNAKKYDKELKELYSKL